jgi:hypothetical protein
MSDLKEVVQDRYGNAARRVRTGEGLPADCCSKPSCCEGAAALSCDPITSDLYDETKKAACRKRPFSLRLAAAIRLRWLN